MSRGNISSRLERLEASARSGPSGRCPECGLRPQDNGYIVVDDNDPAGHNPGGVSGVRKKHQDSHPRGLRRRGGGGGYLMTKCSGITQAGTACKGIPIDGSQWCYVHHPDHAEERRRHGSKGGRRGGRGRPVAELGALRDENGDIRRRLLEGELLPNVAAVAVQSINADIRAVGAVLKAREQEEIIERLEELERVLEARESRRGA